jgi:hypothetical protein
MSAHAGNSTGVNYKRKLAEPVENRSIYFKVSASNTSTDLIIGVYHCTNMGMIGTQCLDSLILYWKRLGVAEIIPMLYNRHDYIIPFAFSIK